MDPANTETQVRVRVDAVRREDPSCPRGNAGDRSRHTGGGLGTIPSRDGSAQNRATHSPESGFRAADARGGDRPEPTTRGTASELLHSGIGSGTRKATCGF